MHELATSKSGGLGHTRTGSLSSANTKFCLDFFKEQSKVKRNENIFFSPLSISAALSMVQLGTSYSRGAEHGKSKNQEHHWKEEIASELCDNIDLRMKRSRARQSYLCEEARGAHSQFQELLSALGKAGATCSLRVANKLFGEVSFQFLQKSEFSLMDETQNEQRKIKDLFPPGSVGHTPVLALVNAIHFKGQWAIKFEEKNSREMPFRLNRLESAVTYEKLAEWTNMENVYPQKIMVYLPQFRKEESCELIPALQALGMRGGFGLQQADFSGLSREPGLFLSKAIHKFFVEVNEEGTKAAATGVTIILLCFHIPYEFRTDHLFLFSIKHNPSKNIIFSGQCCSP
nr:PREDICTED: serpin B10-like [Pelecanus crispus]